METKTETQEQSNATFYEAKKSKYESKKIMLVTRKLKKKTFTILHETKHKYRNEEYNFLKQNTKI